MPPERVRRRDSLRTRLALWSGAINGILVLLVLGGASLIAREAILRQAEASVREQSQAAASNLAASLRSVRTAAAALTRLASRDVPDDAQRLAALHALVDADPSASGGSLILVAPGQRTPRWAQYVAKHGTARDLERSGELVAASWLPRTLSSTEPWWSEPYQLSVQPGAPWYVAYNLPVRSATDGRVLGMVGLEVPLATLVAPMQGLVDSPDWDVTLVAPGGTVAVHRDPAVAHTPFPAYVATQRPDLAPALALPPPGQSIAFRHRDAQSGEPRYTRVVPVGDLGWKLLVSLSNRPVLAAWTNAMIGLVLGALVLGVGSALAFRRLARRIGQPIEELGGAAARLGAGDYTQAVPHTRRRDEVGQLARALEGARTSIRDQLAQIGTLATARERADGELAYARGIQRSMLPAAPTITVAGRTVTTAALLQPAKAVGGDFYTFVQPGTGELWFALGDVSGKGIPAALFMARVATVIEIAAGTAPDPAHALSIASRLLCEGNDECMFATVVCGRIDVASGACTIASAAHEAPLWLPIGGHAVPIGVRPGPVLGIDPHPPSAFPEWEGELQPGDGLLAYTDGITEAFDAFNEGFGITRLLRAADAARDPGNLCDSLVRAVHAHAYPAAQSDDLTVLALRMGVTMPTEAAAEATVLAELSIPGDASLLAGLNDHLDVLLALEDVSEATRGDVRLVVEELVGNAIGHGAGVHQVDVRVSRRPGALILELRDDGDPFDPLALALPDIDAPLELRPIGGLGIFLVRRICDQLAYHRDERHNHVQALLHLPDEDPRP